MWKIPLFDISFDKLEADAAERVIRSRWLTMGDVTEKFERDFAHYIGVKHAIALTNCTAALHIANLALGIGDGDEVIVPALTFVAGPNSVLYSGAKPVFADISGNGDLAISPREIEQKITKKTRAIQVLHYAGTPCDMRAIMTMARRRRILVIEDCAHAIGAKYESKRCGAIGDIGVFSFFSNKNMTTGEGGMATTNDDDIAKKLRLMRSHGMTTLTLDRYRGHAFNYDVVSAGFNYRIDEIRSAIGLVQLKKLHTNNDKRRELVSLYKKHLADISQIELYSDRGRSEPSCHIFPILLKDGSLRHAFISYMKNKGIQTSIHYPAVHLFSYYRNRFGCKPGALPVTEDVASREVTLPLYPSMSRANVKMVCAATRNFFKMGKG